MTFFFLFVILGATDDRAPKGFAPLAIGLCLTLIHLISIPVTNTSVNPARSSSQAFFVGGWALDQLWLFWIAPIVGAILAGVLYPALTRQKYASAEESAVKENGRDRRPFLFLRHGAPSND
jgi:aquaporin Z